MTATTRSVCCSRRPWPLVAEFEADLGHLRTREGMARAKRQAKPALPAFFPAAICISNLIKFLIQFARA